MSKSIIFTLLFLSLSTNVYANFIIKLATYSHKQNLMKQVTQLDKNLQNKIILIEEEHLYKLFSISYKDKEEAINYLSSYQKIFPDAYIMIDKYKHTEKKSLDIVLALQVDDTITNKEKNISILPVQDVLQPKNPEYPSLTFEKLFKNRTYFLSPDSINTPSERLLIKASFEENNVSYTTLIGNIPPMEKKYILRHNRLYLINHNKISPSQYSTIDTLLFEYMVVARWFKGKKIHKMRYYKKEEDARSYLDSIHFD